MDYFSLGSKISYSDFNAIVYLLRKFKRLTSDLTLGSNRIESDYGVYNVAGGLTSVGGNFILEDDVTISSSDVLLNCFYTFYFTVVDVNLSGTVNRRVISVTGDTGDGGILEVVLEPSLLESDEVILPEFKVDIVFDEHEYYTPLSAVDITLTVDKSYISVGEVATVTATVLDDTGTPVSDLYVQFNFNGDIVTDTTDSDGIASAEYTGTGAGWINVAVMGEFLQFYDGNIVTAEYTGSEITLGYRDNTWLINSKNVIIDWGDGTTSTVNNPHIPLTHNYTDEVSSHDIKFIGEVISIGRYCFFKCFSLTSIVIPDSVVSLGDQCFQECSNLTSVVIPDSVVILGYACFNYCTSLTSVTIPDSVTRIGIDCFALCSALVDYELYWTGNDIITYDCNNMPNNTNTIFTIPQGETANYTAKGYPTDKLIERGESLTITADKSIIQTTETSTITATLKDTGTPLTSKTLNYIIKHGSTTITSGTKTTDSNGQANITYTGTGIGNVQVIVSYTNIQETYELLDYYCYDGGVTGNKSTAWTASSNISISTDDTGTLLSASSNQTYTSTKLLTGDFEATFTATNSGGIRIGFNKASNQSVQTKIITPTIEGTYYYKINRIGTTWRFQYSSDGETWNDRSISVNNITDEDCYFLFSIEVVGSTRTIKYKDLKIYSI